MNWKRGSGGSWFDAQRRSRHLRFMWFSRRFRSVTAGFLAAALLVLATGVPSHHHEAVDETHGAVVIGPDHHSHATILVDQGGRIASSGPEFAPIGGAHLEPLTYQKVPLAATRETTIRPRERAPPPNHSPRAPPHLS